jgi:serine/threonine protein phosphatase PrpC
MKRKTSVTSASAVGSKSFQEDRYQVCEINLPRRQGLLLAVMDGHGGSETVEIVNNNLVHFLQDELLG